VNILNFLELLIASILIVFIGSTVLVTISSVTYDEIRNMYSPYILRAMIEKNVGKTRENKGILVIKKDMMLLIEPSKIEKIPLKNFKIEKIVCSQSTRQIIRFINGEVSLAGSIVGRNWKLTVEPVTGRIRVYVHR